MLKRAISKRLNALEILRENFMFWYVDFIKTIPASRVVENEPAFFEKFKNRVLQELEKKYINEVIDINIELAKTIAKASGLEYKPGYKLPSETIELIKERFNITTEYQVKDFDLKMQQLTKRPVEFLEADWELSKPKVKETRQKATNSKARFKRSLSYGAGKYYVPILKSIGQIADKAITRVASVASTGVMEYVK